MYPDFEELDKKNKYTYREDKLQAAKNLGYDYISEALYKLHIDENWPLKQIAPKMDYSHTLSVKAVFKKYGWPYRKEARGGNRNFSQLYEYVDSLRQEFKEWVAAGKRPRDFFNAKARIHKVNYCSIRVCVLGKTWKNN